jgi:hypothetical protein
MYSSYGPHAWRHETRARSRTFTDGLIESVCSPGDPIMRCKSFPNSIELHPAPDSSWINIEDNLGVANLYT